MTIAGFVAVGGTLTDSSGGAGFPPRSHSCSTQPTHRPWVHSVMRSQKGQNQIRMSKPNLQFLFCDSRVVEAVTRGC